MSEPLALLPLALAAGGGSMRTAGAPESMAAQQLVAAGLTLLQRSAPLVRALSGRRAAILLPTSPAFLTALAASEGRGAVLVNPLASAVEVAYQCADADVGAVFTIESLADRVPAGLPIVLLDEVPRTARVVTIARTQEVDLGSHHGLSIEGERDVPGRDEEAAIVYTSAMRGVPLGAVLTHANLLANARSAVDAMGMHPGDELLAFLPYSHLFGLTVGCAAPLLVGAAVTTMPRFHPGRAIALVREGITALIGVPTTFGSMLAELVATGTDLRDSTLRLCVCGGAPLSVELQERWADATGVELRQGFGLTEAAPVCLFNRIDRPNVRGTLGVPFDGVDVAIVRPLDDDQSARDAAPVLALQDGAPGEICVRGANVFRGYLGAPDAGLLRQGDWLRTGDEGVRNADGTVAFLRVLKPMFTRNGFNIYPRELERAVRELPGVRDAEVSAMSPLPRKDRGIPASREHDIRLRVWGTATADEVKQWCERRLSAYKQPTTIEIVEG